MKKYPDVALLEFQFTNRKMIPPNAKRIVRDERAVIKKRQNNGVTAGEHGQANQVTVKPFVKQLFSLGYKITDLHFYLKNNGDSVKARFVLVINFTRNGVEVVGLGGNDVKILSQLINRDAWGYFHLWKNPNGVMSVHCLHRVPNGGNGQGVGEFLLESPIEAGFDYEDVMRS